MVPEADLAVVAERRVPIGKPEVLELCTAFESSQGPDQ
jgi:hypothetical protein